MTDLPDPLTPADCDLRDFPWMPLVITQLIRSKAWRLCKRKPDLAFYMVNLWTASWHELPAASLDDDDELLCDLAMCDPKKWPSVRETVMRNWVRCNDGRIYHPTVAAEAKKSWENKVAQRARTEAATAARLAKYNAKRGSGGPDDNSGGDDTSKVSKPTTKNGTKAATLFDTNTLTNDVTSRLRSPHRQTDRQTDRQGQTVEAPHVEPDDVTSRAADAPPTLKRGTRLPSNWHPGDDGLAICVDRGLDFAETLASFRDFWSAKSGQDATKLDWDATWRNWCRREKPRPTTGAPATKRQREFDDNQARIDELMGRCPPASDDDFFAGTTIDGETIQ